MELKINLNITENNEDHKMWDKKLSLKTLALKIIEDFFPFLSLKHFFKLILINRFLIIIDQKLKRVAFSFFFLLFNLFLKFSVMLFQYNSV